MSWLDIVLQIGTGAFGGAIAGVVASLILTAIKARQRRRDQRIQVAYWYDYVLWEFTHVAKAPHGHAGLLGKNEDELRDMAARVAWDRLRAAADHFTEALKVHQRGELHRSVNELQSSHHIAVEAVAGTTGYSLELLRMQYTTFVGRNRWLNLPTQPPWEQPSEAPIANKTV